MEPPRLNLAFLGCGRIAASHGRFLAGLRKDVRCFYASRDAERAMTFERRLGGNGSYSSYEAALADGRIDAVFVTTPPSSHLELALAALRSGKHVIVEKPPFLRCTDFDCVASAQAETGRRVLVAENYFYKPLARTLQAIIASGDVGELRLVVVNALKCQASSDWRAEVAHAGGGALFEGGIHWVDLLANLGPAVRSVQGFRLGPADGRIERSMGVVAEYEGGGAGVLFHSWNTPSPLGPLRLSRIYGSEGSIAFESNGLFVLVRGRKTRLLIPGLRDLSGRQAMLRDFVRALRTGVEPSFTLAHARRDLELVEQACRTACAAQPPMPASLAAL